MYVYRVEDDKRCGPYAASRCPIKNVSAERQPTPWRDKFTEAIGPNDHFGFQSKAALGAWFEAEDRKKLVEAGFRFCVYEVSPSHVKKAKKQLVFDHRKAKLVMKSKSLSRCATSGSSRTPTTTTRTSSSSLTVMAIVSARLSRLWSR